jgi:beta-lactamase class D
MQVMTIDEKKPSTSTMDRLLQDTRLPRVRHLIIILFWLACASSGFCATLTNLDLSEFFGGRGGCFVLYDSRADSYIRYNPNGCTERFTPCSTFKIANSLIALQSGVVTGPEFSLWTIEQLIDDLMSDAQWTDPQKADDKKK